MTKIWRRAFVVTTPLVLVIVTLVGIPSAAQPQCTPTRPDSLGPFYEPDAPERNKTGQGLVISGMVRSASDCEPIVGAQIEWWSTNPRGRYDDEHRATQKVNEQGRYRYETDFPNRYPGRPPHLHVRVTAPGHQALITQIYPRPEQTKLKFDFVLVPNDKDHPPP